MQFRAQDTGYRAQFPEASFDVVEKDGECIGRLYVNKNDSETRIIDISLLSEWRNHGIGGALLQDVLEESARAGRPVTLHVEASSPARRLYERLGFSEVDDRGVYVFMKWSSRQHGMCFDSSDQARRNTSGGAK